MLRLIVSNANLISDDSALLNTVISNAYGYCANILNDIM